MITTSALPKTMGYKKALEAMSRAGTRLVKMREERSPSGFAYYLVPGGYIDPAVADKLRSHPYCRANEDGLFPGHDQTWTMMTDTPQGFE